MKKFTVFLTVLAMLAGNVAQAQSSSMSRTKTNQGNGANLGAKYTYDNSFNWAFGLGALAIVGVIVGLTVAGATQSGSQQGHS